MDKKNNALELRCQRLEKRSEAPNVTRLPENLPEELLHEGQDRHRRRKYVIVSGLPENASGTIRDRIRTDMEVLGKVIHELGVEDFHPQVTRIGRINPSRPRLLRFKCDTIDSKISLLRASRNLRYSSHFRGVYINSDLTKMQRETDKALRTEMRRRREAGESVLIRRGRIVDQSGDQNFHQRS